MKFLSSLLLLCHIGLSAGFVPNSPQLMSCWGYNRLESQLRAAPEPLASEGDWTAFLDEETTGLIYYFNGRTGESRWEPPTSTFPSITLKRSVKSRADAKREEYQKTMGEKTKEKKGFLSTLLEEPKAEVKEEKPKQEEKPKKEEDDWFGSLFEDTKPKTSEKLKKKEEGDWFGFLSDDKKYVAPKEKAEREAAAEEAEEEPSFLDKMFQATAEVKAAPEEIEVVEKETPISIDMASYVLAHPAKIFWGGEDAVFCEGRTFGVFDGVSGAVKLDGVPLYSKTLAKEMQKTVGEQGLNIPEMTRQLTRIADFTDKTATGASTALVASIGSDGFLRALNLGDSTCIVIRDGRVAAKTKEISHYFDCPYQLSAESPDRPKDGTKLNVELVRGDLILMGSDGIFDNLTDEQIIDVIESSPKRLQTIAKRISDESRKISTKRNIETPYAKLAQKNGDPEYADGLGGKVDDVSCVVVRYD